MNDQVEIHSATNGIDLSRLEKMAGFLLRLSQLQVYDSFHTTLAGHGITPTRYSLLAVLHDNPSSRPGQIAEALRVKPSNMATLLQQFEREGLIQRLPDPAERRAALVELTERGETLFAEIDPLVRALEDQAVAVLNPAEVPLFLDMLIRVAGLRR
jgi:DNA-binding MarR family transcriptional regulator